MEGEVVQCGGVMPRCELLELWVVPRAYSLLTTVRITEGIYSPLSSSWQHPRTASVHLPQLSFRNIFFLSFFSLCFCTGVKVGSLLEFAWDSFTRFSGTSSLMLPVLLVFAASSSPCSSSVKESPPPSPPRLTRAVLTF